MSITHIDSTPKQFQYFTAIPIKGAFQMVNLLKFKETIEETGQNGEALYEEYVQAVLPFFQNTKAKIIYQGKPIFGLIGPEDIVEWDKIVIIEYASKEEFIGIITQEGYPAALRSSALKNSRLIVCV